MRVNERVLSGDSELRYVIRVLTTERVVHHGWRVDRQLDMLIDRLLDRCIVFGVRKFDVDIELERWLPLVVGLLCGWLGCTITGLLSCMVRLLVLFVRLRAVLLASRSIRRAASPVQSCQTSVCYEPFSSCCVERRIMVGQIPCLTFNLRLHLTCQRLD